MSKVLENLLDVHLGFEEDALLRNLARVLILELAGDFVIAANQSVLKHCTIFIASGVSQVPPNLLPNHMSLVIIGEIEFFAQGRCRQILVNRSSVFMWK